MTHRSLISARQLHDKLVNLRILERVSSTPLPPPPNPLFLCDSTVTSQDPESDFLDAHIPGAAFFDLNECADSQSGLIRTVPSPSLFEDYVNSIGIGASTSIVAYDSTPGFGGFFSAPRVWWLFRLFGHDDVSVLNGGFDIWKKAQYPIASSKDDDSRPRMSQIPEKQIFRAKPRPNLVKSYEQILDSIEDNNNNASIPLIDARGRGDHDRAHIPFAKNLLFKQLVDPSTGTLKTLEELDELFEKNAGVDLTTSGRKFISSCVTGTTSCSLNLTAQFAAEERGLEIETAVYDGSMQEWMALDGPLESGN